MADANQDYSRLNNKNRRRKPRKWLSLVLAIAGVALVVVLLIAVLNDKPSMDEQANGEQNNKTIAEQIQGNNDTGSSGEEDTEQTDDEKQDDEKEKEGRQEAEPSDANVKEAYTQDWEPVGTEQTGTHTTTFQQGTQDWNEILQAAGGAVGLDPATLTPWYIGNNGNGGNDVVATISGPGSPETFRVYASWVDGEGWQATKVEVLKENDRN